ncbi:unnamed protein product [Lactuca saligna]|uniref:Uncharacterized protein n=1 Tax=Lactuca saligna TaxID=75948 RepID=A0AA35VZS9_LACSI|nr:unnamed protein product [Lactuca saligna]
MHDSRIEQLWESRERKVLNNIRERIWLSWHGYRHWCLLKTFQENNLVALEMHHNRIEQLWESRERKVLNNLRFLDLSYSNLKTLDCGLFLNMEKINLEKCSDLIDLHTPIGCLIRLVNLDLYHCCGLKSFSFVKQLESLEGGNVLKKLPEDLGLLESLEKLNLAYCKIRDVTSSICKLKHLKNLDLHNCDQLERLLEKLGDIKCLEQLDVEGAGISHLPQSISLLNGLKIVGFK